MFKNEVMEGIRQIEREGDIHVGYKDYIGWLTSDKDRKSNVI